MPVFRRAQKCIVWIPFGLIDILIWFGFSKASQGRLFEPHLWECDRRSLGSRKGLTQNRCRGLVCFVFLDYPSSKRVLTRGYHLIILHGSRQRKWKVLKTSRLVIGRNSPAGWPACRAYQTVTLQSCDRLRPNWLSQKKLLRSSFVASWVWPIEWLSSTSGVLKKVGKLQPGPGLN